jgi:cytochrome c551/c552
MHLHSRNISFKTILGIAATAALLTAGQAIAADESELAQKSGCLSCHKGVEKRIGPPYKDVAEKYAGQKDAEVKLAEHIVKGTGPSGLGWMKDGKATLPFMPPNGNVTPKNAAKLAKWVLSIKEEIADTSKFVTESITVSGAVEQPLKLSVADLRQFPPQQVGEVPVVCQSGANLGKLENLKGVLLRDILEKAKVVSHSHNDVKKMVIIAVASDDYKVVFSWSEVFNSPIGEGVMVFFEKNGLPLADDEGRIAMVSSKDIRTGPRHVKWLKSIEVRKIVE